MEDLLRKKAELIIEGEVHIPESVRLPVFPIKSAGGPTSARPHYILGFQGTRVKVAKGPVESRFELRAVEEGLEVFDTKRDRTFLGKVSMIPAVLHAPDQAFINIEPTCDKGCLFCTSHDERRLDWPPERWVDLVVERYKKEPFLSVAVTTGMPEGPEKMLDMMVEVVAGLRERLARIPIGVEPNAVDMEGLTRLKEAGADELKVNIQTATPDIFKKVCPGLDRDEIVRSLMAGVKVFGKGPVASNLIVGLGETDEDIIACMEGLVGMGIAVNLRVLRVNQINRGPLEEILGTKVGVQDPERVIGLARTQKDLFQKHGIDPSLFFTMCHRCGCCDVTVGLDI